MLMYLLESTNTSTEVEQAYNRRITMAISRSQLVKELEPGLNALFGLEYNRYENQHAEIYTTETSDRAFEEEVMLSGFASAPVKQEGAGVVFDQATKLSLLDTHTKQSL